MFTYTGPRNLRVAGLWDEPGLYAAAYQDLLKRVHVLVGTPDYLSRVAVSGKLQLQNVNAMVIDEADACLDAGGGEPMAMLLRRMTEARQAAGVPPPQTVLAGASLELGFLQRAAEGKWVRAPTLATELGCAERATELEALQPAAANRAPPGSREAAMAAAVGWSQQRVPAGQRHEYVVCGPTDQPITLLARLLRERFVEANSEEDPPRVVVFAPSASDAIDLASRLQGALWSAVGGDAAAGLWGLSVLLPSAEEPLLSNIKKGIKGDDELTVLESSLRVMEMFQSNQTSILVTTAAATRGLDFPMVTDVLNLGVVGSAADYQHRAGRIGRIGQAARGRVLSVLRPSEVDDLKALGEALRFEPRERALPPPAPLREDIENEEGREEVKERLETLFYLSETANDDGVDVGDAQ